MTATPWWVKFALRTVVTFAIGVFVLVVGAFLLIHLIGGDPVRNSVGLTVSEAQITQIRESLHLNEPLLTQFAHYVQGLVQLNLGESIVSQQPVSTTLRLRLPNTLELAFAAMLVVAVSSITVGTILGTLTQAGQRPRVHVAFTSVTAVLTAIPEVLMATLLVFLFAVTWHVFPVFGKSDASSFVLPAAALAIPPAALLARVVRLETVRVLGSDYIRTARSKHLPWRFFYLRHVLRNSLTGAIALGNVIFISLIGGSVVIENVFGWPGVGTTLVAAIVARDYPVVQGILLVLGLLILVVNTLVDVVLGVLNPRSVIRDV